MLPESYFDDEYILIRKNLPSTLVAYLDLVIVSLSFVRIVNKMLNVCSGITSFTD